MSYLIGIDSGFTRTSLAIFPRDSTLAAASPSYTSEMDLVIDPARPDAELDAVLSQLFRAIAGRTHGEPVFLWISCAAYSPNTETRLCEHLEPFLGNFEGSAGIANDGVTLLLSRSVQTVIAIVGTGSVVMGRTATGEVIQRGGYGWVGTDSGSGFWIGLKGIRDAYRGFEDGDDTSLLSRLRKRYDLLPSHQAHGDDSTVIPRIVWDLAHSGYEMKAKVAAFAPDVLDLAERADDQLAQLIVEEAAHAIADDVGKVYRALDSSEATGSPTTPRVVLCGGIPQSNAFFEPFRARVDWRLEDIRRRLGLDAVEIIRIRNGTADCIELARRMAADDLNASTLDPRHRYEMFTMKGTND
jgi:N-acetylglucosamine kinase-like BadF-type ATPase